MNRRKTIAVTKKGRIRGFRPWRDTSMRLSMIGTAESRTGRMSVEGAKKRPASQDSAKSEPVVSDAETKLLEERSIVPL
jgi:hypothetical protein